jgi:hypothetical protein
MLMNFPIQTHEIVINWKLKENENNIVDDADP